LKLSVRNQSGGLRSNLFCNCTKTLILRYLPARESVIAICSQVRLQCKSLENPVSNSYMVLELDRSGTGRGCLSYVWADHKQESLEFVPLSWNEGRYWTRKNLVRTQVATMQWEAHARSVAMKLGWLAIDHPSHLLLVVQSGSYIRTIVRFQNFLN